MRRSKQMLLIAIGAFTTSSFSFFLTASAGDHLNQLGRLVGAGWSDGYHARKVDAYRFGENLPPQSSSSGHGHHRYVYQQQPPTPVFGCSNCGGSSVGHYQYAPSVSGSIQQWQPSRQQHGPQWDGYSQGDLEALESDTVLPTDSIPNHPVPAVQPKAALKPQPAEANASEELEPASPSDSQGSAKSRASDETLSAPSSSTDADDLLGELPEPKDADMAGDDDLLDDDSPRDQKPSLSNESDDDLLLDPEDNNLAPDLDASRRATPSRMVRVASTRISSALNKKPHKIGASEGGERSAESNRPIRLPASFR